MKFHIFAIVAFLLATGKAWGQIERKDSIHYELRPEALDAIRRSFGEQQLMEKAKIGFNLELPQLVSDSFKIRRALTLKPYRFDTKFNEDPIYDHLSKEERMAAGIGVYKYVNKFSKQPSVTTNIGSSMSGFSINNLDFDRFLSVMFSSKYRQKKKNRKFIETVLKPAFAKEQLRLDSIERSHKTIKTKP